MAAEELGVFEGVGAAFAAGPDVVDFEEVEGEVFVAAVAVAFLLSVEGVLDLASGHLGAVGADGGGGVDGEGASAYVEVGLGHAEADLVDGFGGYVDAGPLASQLFGGDAGGGAAAEGV